MKKRLMVGLAPVLFSLCIAGTASAASLSVAFNDGTTNTTTALTGFSTTGAMMDGMGVTAFFTGGGSETKSWADSGPSSGGVSGTGWSLTESGDTFNSNWTLTASTASINKIIIDAGKGDSVFDTQHMGDIPGTDGSARGWNFELKSANSWDILATYSDAVALDAANPVGDLYRYLTIEFLRGNFGSNQSLTFLADTDNLQFPHDITPKPVPEPATMLLMGTGLAGLVGSRLRRKKA